MIGIGLVIGFIAGSVVWTLLYSPVVERLQAIEHQNGRIYELLEDSIKTARRYMAKNEMLEYELDRRDRLTRDA